MSYFIEPTAQVDTTEVICARAGAQPIILLVRPADIDIVLSYMQETGHICGTKEIKTDPATLEEFAVDITQL